MKKKKTDFEARFWSGTRKYSAVSLLETFFQFNDRSLVRAGRLIGEKTKKGTFEAFSDTCPSIMLAYLSAEEYRNPVQVLRHAFKTFTLQEYDEFLSAAVYFSLGNQRCEEERRIMVPYIRLIKMLDAAWLITERASTEKMTGK